MTLPTRLVLAALLGLIPTLALSQQRGPADSAAAVWQKKTYAEDRFEVEFSGPVKVEPTQIDAATKKKVVRSTQYLQDGTSFVYIVGVQLNIDTVNFDAGAKASFSTFKCKTTLPVAELPFPGGQGREYKGSECFDGTVRTEAKYFVVGKWFYQVIALFPADAASEQSARRFLTSFKILQP